MNSFKTNVPKYFIINRRTLQSFTRQPYFDSLEEANRVLENVRILARSHDIDYPDDFIVIEAHSFDEALHKAGTIDRVDIILDPGAYKPGEEGRLRAHKLKKLGLKWHEESKTYRGRVFAGETDILTVLYPDGKVTVKEIPVNTGDMEDPATPAVTASREKLVPDNEPASNNDNNSSTLTVTTKMVTDGLLDNGNDLSVAIAPVDPAVQVITSILSVSKEGRPLLALYHFTKQRLPGLSIAPFACTLNGLVENGLVLRKFTGSYPFFINYFLPGDGD